MYVCHVNIGTRHLAADGIAATVGLSATYQAAAGHLVDVLDAGGDGSSAGESYWRDTVPALVKAFKGRLTNGDRPDIVHFHSVFRPVHAWLAGICRNASIPYVVSPHSGLARHALERDMVRKRAYIAAIERTFLRRAAAVVCLTNMERNEVAAVTAGRSPLLPVVPNPVQIATSDVEWTPRQSIRPTLLALCRYDVRHKGLDIMASIAGLAPELDIKVFGAADHNEPRRLERLRRAAPRNFMLLPPLSGADKMGALRQAALYLAPSRWEGMSMSILEAMAVGLPCAVSAYVGESMEVRAGDLGLVLDDSPEAAVSQIRAALADRARLLDWSRRSACYVKEHLSIDRVGGQLLEAYALARGARSDIAVRQQVDA